MRKVINPERVRTWEAWGGACCFLAGILAALLGSLLTVAEWIVGGEHHPWLHAVGTALFIVAIPLILFAGFCLDWSERRPDNASDNDRDQVQRKAQPGSITISRETRRRDAEVRQDEEFSLVAGANGNGRGIYTTGLAKSQLETRGEHAGIKDSKSTESARAKVGRQTKGIV